MQGLTDWPRDHLTAGQVRELLVGDHVEVAGGCEVLNPDLTLREDLGEDFLAGTVERELYAPIHADCSLLVARELDWGTALLRPYTEHSAGGLTARFYLGAFCLTTPRTVHGEDPQTWAVQGFDRLYLLDREVGDTYVAVADGVTDVLGHVRDAFDAAGLSGVLLDGSATGTLLPTDRVWPLVSGDVNGPTTWLRVINDLLSQINYRGVWCDEQGRFRSGPYVEPAERSPEFIFDADEVRTIVGESRTVTRDIWAVPNRWVFVRRNLPGDPPPEPTSGAGLYVVDNVDGSALGISGEVAQLTSQAARGLVWPVRVEYDAASQAALEALGQRRVHSDLAVATTYEVSTGPLPVAGHADVFTFRDGDDERKVQAVRVSVDVLGSDTAWTWVTT